MKERVQVKLSIDLCSKREMGKHLHPPSIAIIQSIQFHCLVVPQLQIIS